MSQRRSHRAARFALHALVLGAAGCADLLGVSEGTPRPAGGGGAGGAGDGGGGGGAPAAAPDAPRVLFTDLESGPAGTYVTLYGVRLVEGDDAPKVTFAGVQVDVVEARDGALAAGTVARALDVVVVQVGHGVPSGVADVVARRGGKASEPVPFTVRPGTLRFVATNGGSDQSPDCAEAAPCASLGKLTSVIAPGDIAYVRQGDYPGDFTCGVDFAGDPILCALPLADLATPGTAQQPIAVVGYPGERPRVGLLGAPANAENRHLAFRVAGAGHVVLSNLAFTDVGSGGTVTDTDSLRVVGCSFDSYALEGLQMASNVDAVTILGSTFASGVLPTVHGLNACGATKVVVEVGFSEFNGVPGPLAFDPTEVLDMRFHSNLLRGVFAGLDLQTCAGANPQPLGRTAFFNNVVDDAGYAVVLPREDTFGAEILVFNNTFSDFFYCGFRRELPAAFPIPAGEAIHLRNNIVVPLVTPYLCFHDAGIVTPAAEVGLTGSHNLFWAGTGALPAALGVEANPLLAGDLSLGPGSPGIDAGTEALGPGVEALPPFVRFDHGGLPRVLGAAIDIGAHERLPE